jgi:cytochrome b subunit of formate dehydrogenase/nitrate/TMAO reductase-like tetraheme cytochrome c subunit
MADSGMKERGGSYRRRILTDSLRFLRAGFLLLLAMGASSGRTALAQDTAARAAARTALAQQPPAHDDAECDKCHADAFFLEGRTDSPEGDAALLVASAQIRDSDHASLSCSSCHPEHGAGYPHRTDERAVSCGECHAAIEAEYLLSFHAQDRRSPTHALNVDRVCAGCHADPAMIERRYSAPEDSVGRIAAARWHETVHGAAQVRAGLQIVATCNDCHSSHSIFPPDSAASTLSRQNIAVTCSKCHLGIEEVYLESFHGLALLSGDTLVHTAGGYDDEGHLAPVCNDCHPGHKLVSDTTAVWRIGTVEECGTCHERVYETYFDTYHGQTTALGNDIVAKCADCHPPHDTRAPTDPLSSVHADNIIATCGQCHEESNANFVQYYAHGDPKDRENYPVLWWARVLMLSLLGGVWTFFGVHTGLWFTRLTLGRFRGETHGIPGAWRRTLSASDRGEGPYLMRFQLMHRVFHAMIIVSFFGLVATGTPLLFPETGWAQLLMGLFGGTEAAAGIHRICAVITFGYFFGHVIHLSIRIWRSPNRASFFRGPDSMAPRKKDFQDIGQMFRWFFFRGERPKFDRWTYMDKFDYWGEVWGVTIIGGTGLLLWFPNLVTQVLPGWWFNVATIVHGIEALLAAGIIFSAHFFNVHWRPDKFPVDLVMFTGRATVEYMEEEHPLELERLRSEGRLEELVVDPPTQTAYLWASVLGIIAAIIGMTLIALMLWALLTA